LLFLVNLPLYRFFSQKRGFWFMMGTIPWNWLYYFYSGLAFTIGLVQFFFSGRKSFKVGLSAFPGG